jgi:hypothetical protein
MVEYPRTARQAWRCRNPPRVPRTHYFAQARCVFAVAAHRCREVFDPPHSVTLWQLPEPVEEVFDATWERWLDQADEWTPFFQKLETLKEND